MARVIVCGTWRSGSSATAGMMAHLGVDMGDTHIAHTLEDEQLAMWLQEWFCEPRLFVTVPRQTIVAGLVKYLASRSDPDNCGAKHPILTLCLREAIDAWGADTKIVWTRRKLKQAVLSLRKTRWWPGYETEAQAKIYAAAEEAHRTLDVLAIDWEHTCCDPMSTVKALCEHLNLSCTSTQIHKAAKHIR